MVNVGEAGRERPQGALRAIGRPRGLEGKAKRFRQGVFELVLFHAQFEKDSDLPAPAGRRRGRADEARVAVRLGERGAMACGRSGRYWLEAWSPAGRFPPARSEKIRLGGREGADTGDGNVDAVEERFLMRGGGHARS